MHGDSSISTALTNLGSYWKNNPLLIKPNGSYGSINGDSPSADRYIECGMSEFAWDCYFSEWQDELVDFKLNYSGDILEPEFLPAKYPVALFLGNSGMGYGLYSGIPAYNISETIDLVIALIENPNKRKVYLIPDFPNGCDIVNDDFELMCEKGEGTVQMRGRLEINEKGNIEIKSIPFQTTLEKIVEVQLPNLVNEGKILGIADVKDHSKAVKKKVHGNTISILDIDVELVLKKGANPYEIIDKLYKSTSLSDSFSVEFELVYDYQNIHYNLRSYILEWINFRRDTKRRNYLKEYSALNKRYHMLLCIERILSNPKSDKINMEIARKSKNRSEIITKLMKQWDITDLQADVIADFKQYQYSKESLNKFKDERERIEDRLDVIYDLIQDDNLIDDEIITELKECKKKYGEPRKCPVITVRGDDYVEETDHVIVITKRGLIKKLPYEKGITEVGNLEPGDKAVDMIVVNNTEELLVFDNIGKCYTIAVNDITSDGFESIGYPISNYIKTDNKIVKIMKRPDEDDKGYFVFLTKYGFIKKTDVNNYRNINKNGLIATLLKKVNDDITDELVNVEYIKKNKDILIYTTNGMALRFNTKTVSKTLRNTYGVIGIKLNGDDEVLGFNIIDKDKEFLVIITNKGNGKKIKLKNLDESKRTDTGCILINLDNKEKIIGMKAINKDDNVHIFFNNRLVSLDAKDIPTATKIAKAKKIVTCKKGEHIISID